MYEYNIVKVNKVIDGDTVDLVIDLGFNIFRNEKIRLNRVDTPETNSSNELEKKMGIESKIFVTEWLNNQSSLKVKTFKDDKYGRMLGEIIGNESTCLNDVLLNQGYAWLYLGDTKTKDLNVLLEKRNKQ
jgi:micrococcal nuclease